MSAPIEPSYQKPQLPPPADEYPKYFLSRKQTCFSTTVEKETTFKVKIDTRYFQQNGKKDIVAYDNTLKVKLSHPLLEDEYGLVSRSVVRFYKLPIRAKLDTMKFRVLDGVLRITMDLKKREPTDRYRPLDETEMESSLEKEARRQRKDEAAGSSKVKCSGKTENKEYTEGKKREVNKHDFSVSESTDEEKRKKKIGTKKVHFSPVKPEIINDD